MARANAVSEEQAVFTRPTSFRLNLTDSEDVAGVGENRIDVKPFSLLYIGPRKAQIRD